MKENSNRFTAHKIWFLANEFPGKKIDHVIEIMQLPILEINNAIHLLEQEGALHVDKKTRRYDVLTVPDAWDFGTGVDNIKQGLTFAFLTYLQEQEDDLEENYLSNWLVGYSTHDALIAVRVLLNTGMLAEYKLNSPKEGEYKFFTAARNLDKEWGRKQFKKPEKVKVVTKVKVGDNDESVEVPVRFK